MRAIDLYPPSPPPHYISPRTHRPTHKPPRTTEYQTSHTDFGWPSFLRRVWFRVLNRPRGHVLHRPLGACAGRGHSGKLRKRAPPNLRTGNLRSRRPLASKRGDVMGRFGAIFCALRPQRFGDKAKCALPISKIEESHRIAGTNRGICKETGSLRDQQRGISARGSPDLDFTHVIAPARKRPLARFDASMGRRGNEAQGPSRGALPLSILGF